MENTKTSTNTKTFSSEQAYDMLPYAVDIYEKLKMDDYRKKIQKANEKKKNVDKMQLGIDMVKYIVRNSGKVKDEVFELIAIAQNISLEEVKEQSAGKTMKSFKEIFSDKDLVDFFKSAM